MAATIQAMNRSSFGRTGQIFANSGVHVSIAQRAIPAITIITIIRISGFKNPDAWMVLSANARLGSQHITINNHNHAFLILHHLLS
jgi:hypothetical protein